MLCCYAFFHLQTSKLCFLSFLGDRLRSEVGGGKKLLATTMTARKLLNAETQKSSGIFKEAPSD